MTAPAMAGVESVTWDEFLRRFDWQQGEHVSLIGPTGTGKTTLGLELLHRRAFVTAFATKPRDATMEKLIRSDGYKRLASWEARPPVAMRQSMRLVLWPPFKRPEDIANQQAQLDYALRAMFTEGGWCIFADELYYLCRQLRLTPLLEAIWTQGRSIGLSLIGGTQRPAHVPLFVYDQATHLFFWRDNDETNLRRVGGLGGLNARVIRDVVASLPKHAALYVNTRTGELLVTDVNRRP